MKGKLGCKLLYGASALMVLGFFVHLALDRYEYMTTLNSAPFWIWIATDALLWLPPAAIAFGAAVVVQKRSYGKERSHDTGK